MILLQSGCQRQGREKASGQAWMGRRRGEEVLPLLQLRPALLAPLSPCQTGWKHSCFSDFFHGITSQIACSPSPLVQLAETPDEVVVSKDWRQRASQSFFLFYVKLVRLAAVITSNFLIQWWRSSMGLLVIAIDTVWFEAVENKSDLQKMLIFFRINLFFLLNRIFYGFLWASKTAFRYWEKTLSE